MIGEKQIHVYADWFGGSPVYIGRLFVAANRSKEVFSFEYDESWIKHYTESTSPYVALDPDLQLIRGRQYVPSGKTIFGMFSDSCPDRWGRLLMKRREAIQARKEVRKPKQLNESDYLLGVYDETRMGALRFSLTAGGEFLSADRSLAAPPWTTLRTLESASLAFENSTNADEEKWLKQLLAPGSSLGGARPKATVQAPDGSLVSLRGNSFLSTKKSIQAMQTRMPAVECNCNENNPAADRLYSNDEWISTGHAAGLRSKD